ncbi:MAG: hypothetical protein ABSE27_04370 [Acidobacteriaceae bacterium]|jgi:hypothetical protein
MAIYSAYNLLWLAGTMFSYGKNDTPSEALFFCLTFLADIPAFFVITRKLRPGLILFCLLLAFSFALAASQHILNSFSLLYWYAPKLVPLSIAVWAASSRTDTTLSLDTPRF